MLVSPKLESTPVRALGKFWGNCRPAVPMLLPPDRELPAVNLGAAAGLEALAGFVEEIAFGLVNIPVGLTSAEEPEAEVELHMVDKKNNARIRNCVVFSVTSNIGSRGIDWTLGQCPSVLRGAKWMVREGGGQKLGRESNGDAATHLQACPMDFTRIGYRGSS